jgi:hypothetical protein
MNRDSIKEYILWLEKFSIIYKKYIDSIDSSEKLKEIFAETLEKFKKILSGNSEITEDNVIISLKEIVKKFSFAYDANTNIDKTLEGPRNTDAFKQNIYQNEIVELKNWLIQNINNTKLFPDFESLIMFVAKKRQMIEFLKLGKIIDSVIINHCVYFEIFGKIRKPGDGFKSPLFDFHAKHLHNKETEKIKQIKYTHRDSGKIYEDLTEYISSFKGVPMWFHTDASFHPELFQIMNKLYYEFLSNTNKNDKNDKNDKLIELYWLYMQTCPFERGSAAIGEILFSVLLRKYFDCDFIISNGWNRDPLTIPDIHALHYQLNEFKSIFWEQLTTCNLKNNSN